MGLLLLCPLGWEAMLMVQLWEKAIAAFFVFVSEPIYVTIYIPRSQRKFVWSQSLFQWLAFMEYHAYDLLLHFEAFLYKVPRLGKSTRTHRNLWHWTTPRHRKHWRIRTHQQPSFSCLAQSYPGEANIRSRTLGFRLVYALS
jgi:hypothetical protein